MASDASFFVVCYRITTPGVGGPVFTVSLSFDTSDETVHGLGQITQATNPPLDIKTKLHGHYSSILLEGAPDKIIVTAIEDYPYSHWPKYGGIPPVFLPNVKLFMVLNSDWKGGDARYKYRDDVVNWVTIDKAKVESVPCPVPN